MKILIIAMAESIHTARWISLIKDQGWEIFLFPSIDSDDIHPDLKNISFYHTYGNIRKFANYLIKKWKLFNLIQRIFKILVLKIIPTYHTKQLIWFIQRIKPDIIHSMETQSAGYLTLDVKKDFHGAFPLWVHSVWGSDIYLFGRLKKHQDRISEVMASCDYYICECSRDINLASKFGFKGKDSLKVSVYGGFDLNTCRSLRQEGLVSDRRIIMLKGYQSWAGRALVGLRALEMCADILEGYEIVIYSAGVEVEIAGELFSVTTGIPTRIIRHGTLKTHNELLELHGHARLSIGLSISDGFPSSLLEAMVMGSFPIQSNTSCADEWIIDGKSGFIVLPEDPDKIAVKIRTVISDDILVNSADSLNEEIIKRNFENNIIKQKVIDFYKNIEEQNI